MEIRKLLEIGRKKLQEKKNENPMQKARTLLSFVLNQSKEELIMHDLEEVEIQKENVYREYLEKLADGFPIQYIIGNQEFMELDFYVNENVLIPQPDTEVLVEEVMNLAEQREKVKILDIGTGSGCIAISLAKNIKNSEIYAIDISENALEVAKINAKKQKVEKQITFVHSNLFENLEENNFDFIVSNPPYIRTKLIDTLSNEVKAEPILALDGGEDGLKYYQEIVKESALYLKENGRLCFEIGYDQKKQVEDLINDSKIYKEIYSKKDFAGQDRIIIARKG